MTGHKTTTRPISKQINNSTPTSKIKPIKRLTLTQTSNKPKVIKIATLKTNKSKEPSEVSIDATPSKSPHPTAIQTMSQSTKPNNNIQTNDDSMDASNPAISNDIEQIIRFEGKNLTDYYNPNKFEKDRVFSS